MEKHVGLVLWLSWVTYLAGQDAPQNTVFYQCNRTSISVAVKSDPLKNRMLLDPRSLSLGKCPVSSTTALQGFLVFEYKLYDCGFSRMVFGNLVKFFTDLVYRPDAAAVNVFPQPFRKQIICLSNISMIPTPIETTVVVQESGAGHLDFSFQIMNDDFSAPSDIKEFFLGSLIFLAISVETANHMPLQLFVDEAIVAPTNNLSDSEKHYVLINNHGCLVDGKVASSRFVEPLQLDTIRLTFPAMKFVGNDEVYLHFKLIVWDPKTANGLKACSYLREINRWQLLGNPQSDLCSCCDSTCKLSSRRKRDTEDKSDAGIIHTMVLGPFKIHSPSANGSANASNESKALEAVSAFRIPPVVGALFLELAVLVMLLLGVAVYSRSANQDCKEPDKHLLITDVNKSL
ncbi:zona pellucida sperm-binding protein 3-like [Eleutherodactylus coqui]|uniref:zona pellucida sperm-binding protein 3-like n=1 Tax=Eleutherodactylus coqui TaxID=57060 RepID=UPI0034632530